MRKIIFQKGGGGFGPYSPPLDSPLNSTLYPMVYSHQATTSIGHGHSRMIIMMKKASPWTHPCWLKVTPDDVFSHTRPSTSKIKRDTMPEELVVRSTRVQPEMNAYLSLALELAAK